MTDSTRGGSTRPRRAASGLSNMFVPPDLTKHSEILGRHIRWIDDTEDWKARKSQQLYQLEQRTDRVSETTSAYELQRRDDRTYLELKFAELRQEISLLKRDQRHTITIAIVLWVVLTTIFGLAIRFI